MLRVKLPNVLTNGEPTRRGQYRQYLSAALDKAYNAVLDGMAIRKAATTFAVPFATLHDRMSGKVSIECSTTGREPLLSMEEEQGLVSHIEAMANFGYGYTRAEVTTIATDLAIYVGKKSKDEQPLSLQWFYGFMKRWPDLSVKKPRSLEIQRAKATSEETITHYFNELGHIMDKYNLKTCPHRIYNVDEKGLMEHHTPPSVVTSSQSTPAAVTTSRSSTTTVIGCGNASGSSIPPYFVFKGKRMREELLSGSTPGAAGTVSDSGWSNTEIFQHYLTEHFLKHAVAASADSPLLIVYDGHRSHVSIPLIEWARQHHIILFVLPAHTSHVLQPMDVGCFGPFAKIYNNLRHTYMRENATSSVDKHSVCELGCRAYNLSLTPTNLQSSFRKCGVYPFDKSSTANINFAPSTVFKSTEPLLHPDTGVIDSCVPVGDKVVTSPTEGNDVAGFFKDKTTVLFKKAVPTKKRNVLSAVVGGKAITEDVILNKIISHQTVKSAPKKRKQAPKPSKSLKKINTVTATNASTGTSRSNAHQDDSFDSDVTSDDELCCKCSKFVPDEVRANVSLIITTWAQCTNPTCQHWTHLRFCTPVRVVRRHSEFWCPCHDEPEE
ncbi:MFS-type transporter clz9-like [Haliotis rufescens]|uniref:MFS-type transporter clz9-like n=1 Tax=Haliotis rufescens TaxID=6454 RepID=UPI00201F2E09|nr:MFS-type transporter clz9-like [Haliotis rufescens]